MTKLNDDIKKVELGLASELVETVARQVKEKEEEIAFKMQ